MKLCHDTADNPSPCSRLLICQPIDITGNEQPGLVVGRRCAEKLLVIGWESVPPVGGLFSRMDPDLLGDKNPGWERHIISLRLDLHTLGNALGDMTGPGRLDFYVVQGIGERDIYWFEPRELRREHLTGSPSEKYYDLTLGDMDGDAEPELVGTSKESAVLFYYYIPADFQQGPWLDDSLHVVARDTEVEGLAVVDLEGDGHVDIIDKPHEPDACVDVWQNHT